MDGKEAIMAAAIALMEEKGEALEEITVREICRRAGVGLGLVNYHFGNKENLLRLCVARVVGGVIRRFRELQEETGPMAPAEKLEHLGNMTLDFLFDHPALARISVLTDMQSPREDDNTHRTFSAYLPLVAACRPDWDGETLRRKTFCLITVMQQVFLRRSVTSVMLGMDLQDRETRRRLHARILRDILEVER